MGTIAEMYRRWKMLNLRREVPEIIKKTKKDITTLQQQQLYEGKTAENRPITPFYTPVTIGIKKAKNQPVDRVTLRDTGKFYKGIRVTKVNRESFTIDSRDKKNFELVDKYGDEIFGMNTATRIQYIDNYFFPLFKNYIESTTKLKMK